MQPPPDEELQKQTLWLFGVLVGLAVKEAISGVYKHVAEQEHFWGGSLAVVRLFIFLLVAVRFYLGSVQYFYNVYSAASAASDYPLKKFRLDFFFGLGHFIILSILGLSTTQHGSGWWLFPILLAFVLAYDIPWYLASRKLSTALAIRLWTVINAVTLAFAVAFSMVAAFVIMLFANHKSMDLTANQRAACELAAYAPVLFFSMIDLGSLLNKRSAIEEWLSESIHRPKSLGG